MDLERVAAAIRPRSHWEAMDLGFCLVRDWWRPLYGVWLVTVLPLYLLIALPLHAWPGWAFLAFWWLRPLVDRLPLFVLSQGLFGALPTLRTTLHALPRVVRAHVLPALTVYRFDPARSFNLPVWQLEGLRGRERWSRATVLQRDGHGHAVCLTAAASLMEISFGIALFGLLAMAVPQVRLGEVVEKAFTSGQPSPWYGAAWLAFSFVAFSIVEPLYVAAGFTLYLNRRIRLEGWDVELAFRRLSRRLTRPARAGKVVALLMILATVPCGAARAAPPTTPESAIRQVLAKPEFQTKKRLKTWRYVGKRFDRKPDQPRALPFFPSAVLPVAVLAAIAAGLGVLLYRGLKRLPASSRATAEPAPSRPVAVGVEATPEALPADIPGEAWRLWESGERAAALGLLYRGALAGLLRLERDSARSSWTEGEWLGHVSRRGPPERAEYFGALTRAWQAAAYAHRPPAPDHVKALCGHFSRHFGGDA